jgi:hypothetical protein
VPKDRGKYYSAKVTIPASLALESRILRKLQSVEEMRGELAGLAAKAIATLGWLLDHGTPGTQLGAAQTIIDRFLPKAPQVVEQLNYDVADLTPAQQERVIQLAREYRAVLGSAASGRGTSGEAESSGSEHPPLLLGRTSEDATDFWAGTFEPVESEPVAGEGPDHRGREQEREIDMGNDRVDSVGAGHPPLPEDTATPSLHPHRDPRPPVPETPASDPRYAENLEPADVAPGQELDDGMGR